MTTIAKISEEEFQRLEIRVNELIQTCEQLKEENRLLKAQQQSYSSERAKLIEKQEEARSRVESMVKRLQTLETNS